MERFLRPVYVYALIKKDGEPPQEKEPGEKVDGEYSNKGKRRGVAPRQLPGTFEQAFSLHKFPYRWGPGGAPLASTNNTVISINEHRRALEYR